ncbi:MAG: hypothetical protein MPJ25_03880 [Pirellulales bacterium]|nr:hypothetical protein [Pirellulales bacterium]
MEENVQQPETKTDVSQKVEVLDGPPIVESEFGSVEVEGLETQEPDTQAVEEQPKEEVPAEEPAKEEAVVVEDQPKVEETKQEENVVVTEETPVEQQTTQDEINERFKGMMDYLKENPGVTPEEYVNATKGADAYTDDQLLKMQIAEEEGLHLRDDAEEISYIMEEKYQFDDEVDEERDIKKKKVAAKKALRQQKQKLDAQRTKYLTDNRSRASEQAKKVQEDAKHHYQERVNEFFSEEFPGFKFDLGNNRSLTYNVGNVNSVKESLSSPNNLLSEFVDNGKITNPDQYFKALHFAKYGDTVVRRVYEQGRADAIAESSKESKNVNLNQSKPAQGSKQPLKGKAEFITPLERQKSGRLTAKFGLPKNK